MIWTLLAAVVLALGVALLVTSARRLELRRMQQRLDQRQLAVRAGSHAAQLQHPVVDLSRCLGCGTCVAACPEQGVLELIHGQAVVVNGSRCVGHATCERECPVGAIKVTIANLEQRRDVPALSEEFEAIGTPGLFLAGEVTAHALIKTAIEQGASVARSVARRVRADVERVPAIAGRAKAEVDAELAMARRGQAAVEAERTMARRGEAAVEAELPMTGRGRAAVEAEFATTRRGKTEVEAELALARRDTGGAREPA